MELDKPYLFWENETGPHIHFYDEDISYDDYINMLLELGLIVYTPD